MDEPRSVTMNTTLAVSGMIAAGLFAAKTAFTAPGWVWAAGTMFLVLAVTAALLQTSASWRAYLTGTLRKRHYTQVYIFVAGRLNNWVWRRVGRMRVLPAGTEAPPSEATSLPAMLRSALTWRLLDRALFIAVAYPMLALMLPWLQGGDAIIGAGVVVFPAAAFWPERALAALILLVLLLGVVFRPSSALLFVESVITRIEAGRRPANWQKAILRTPWIFNVSELSLIVGIAVIFLVTFLEFKWLAFSAALTFLIFPGISALQITGLAIIFSALFSFGFYGGAGLPLTLSLANMAMLNFILSRDREFRKLSVICFVSGWALVLFSFARLHEYGTLSNQGTAIIIFLAVFPLINGLYDAISYAITLALSRKGLATRWAPLWGLLDLALGAVLFLILGATMVAVIALLNAIGTAPLYDLGALFSGLRASPGDYWWLYLILFSTLAPTALHILVAALAVQGWFIFQTPRRAVARWIEAAPVSHPAAVGGCLAQALIWWLPLMALAFGGWALWQFIGTWATAAGLVYLDIIEGLARWIGAI